MKFVDRLLPAMGVTAVSSDLAYSSFPKFKTHQPSSQNMSRPKKRDVETKLWTHEEENIVWLLHQQKRTPTEISKAITAMGMEKSIEAVRKKITTLKKVLHFPQCP